MYTDSNIYCLVLFPSDGRVSENSDEMLKTQLLQLGLLGDIFQAAGTVYYKLGPRFYQHLSFMGCAPALKLEPDDPEDEKFCYFRFVHYPQPVFRYLRPDSRARCPHCRKPGDSAETVNKRGSDETWHCPHCHTPLVLTDINWKHEAGQGQYFIELMDVHPHEVVPTDGLLMELARITGQEWNYFYATN